MNTYLIPKPITDIVFKYLFGYEKNIKYTYYLLECLYDKEVGYFNNKIKIRNSLKLDRNNIIEKRFELDVVIEYTDKVIINIEAYTRFNNKSLLKSSSYLANLFSSQFTIGNNYDEPKEICQWNIVLKSKYKSKKQKILKLIDNKNLLLEDAELNFRIINLEETNKNNNDKLRRLLKFLNSSNMEEAKENAKGDEILMEMYKSTNDFINNNSEQMKLINKMYYESVLKDDAYDYGYDNGYDNGYGSGYDKGKISVAKNMLQKGYNKDNIIEVTGLTDEEISKLK